MNTVRANIIVRRRENNEILRLVDVTIDEESVDRKLTELRRAYGMAVKLDVSQIKLAREAIAA